MRATWVKRLLLVAIAVVAIAIVAGLVYNLGISSGHEGTYMPMRPFGRLFVADRYGWAGFGLLGLAGMVLFVLLLVWLIGALVSGPSRDADRSRSPEAGASVERLRELSDMHSSGQLTDEEFAAVKRKLLGL